MSRLSAAPSAPLRRLRPIGARAFAKADRRLASVTTLQDLELLQKHLGATRDRIVGPLPDPEAVVAFIAGKTFAFQILRSFRDTSGSQISAISAPTASTPSNILIPQKLPD